MNKLRALLHSSMKPPCMFVQHFSHPPSNMNLKQISCMQKPSKKQHGLMSRRQKLSQNKRRSSSRFSSREMKLKNWKLYKANKHIVEENEKLRHKVRLLRQENQTLLSLFKTSSHSSTQT